MRRLAPALIGEGNVPTMLRELVIDSFQIRIAAVLEEVVRVSRKVSNSRHGA